MRAVPTIIAPMAKPRVLVIGWDAADWKVIQPLLDAGQMPHLARLLAAGLRGNIATLYPVLSPMLWTSIATGKRAYKHGVHGFSEPLPDGSGVRPITLLSRKTKAVWNILNQTGHRSIVAGWWPSHPAEPLNGVMVSNHFPRPVGLPGAEPPLPRGTVYPVELAHTLAELRVNPMELSGEFLRLFVPEYERVDQAKDKRLHSLGRIIAETMSIHAVGTELLATQPWDFAAIYYSGLDHFGHGFMRYHPPRLPHIEERDFEIYQQVIANAYRYHDAMLGTLLGFADDNTTVILMSDHGFHPDHLRPAYIPAEPAGPAVEHRHFGILCMKGPGLRAGEQVFGASLLDICPTILTLFGLPPGKDMDGKVLTTAFKTPPTITPIESWDLVPGEAGTHPAETRLDPVASSEAFKQLVELGYVAPPGDSAQETVEESVRELKYNLARAYRDGNCCGEAAALAEELWTRWPREHRFGMLLLDCLAPLGQVARRRAVLDELAVRMERYRQEACSKLAEHQRQEHPGNKSGTPRSADNARRAQYEHRKLRELSQPRPLLLEWLRVGQALIENQPAEARRRLMQLATADFRSDHLRHRVAGALAELGDFEAGERLLQHSLEADSENPVVHGRLADIHFKAKRFDQAIASATESLSLLYFQPGIHALLGQALMETRQYEAAEQELRVAVSQSPRNLAAHESLARLYREFLPRPDEAFVHEGKARALRHELDTLRRVNEVAPERMPAAAESATPRPAQSPAMTPTIPESFGPDVDTRRIITVVSGLPRSGTSMMMQLLVAAGCAALTDHKRAADVDNPLGYFEFAPTLDLARDVSWLPAARGKVVKVIAQLLPFLPGNEHYHIIFMERDMEEIIASQRAMLSRQGRRGAELGAQKLSETYQQQLNRVLQNIAPRREMRILPVNYHALLAHPAAVVEHLARFVGDPFDIPAAIAAVKPELRRQTNQRA